MHPLTRPHQLGFAATALGTVAELLGLGLDAQLHLHDADLAAREGVFTLTNPGHLLFLAGLGLTVLGVTLQSLPRLQRYPHLRAALLATLTLVAALGLATAALPTSAPLHFHAESEANLTTYTQINATPATWEQFQAVEQMLNETKTATAKYRDVNVARADGYKQEGRSRAGEGAHFINRQILDAGVFDLTHPTFLLYERKRDWQLELVGVGWLLPKKTEDNTPPPYFAPLATWHYHDYAPPGLCIWEDGTTNALAASPCTTQGGRFWPHSPWMLHAWLFRPSPAGMFSLVNSAVDGFESATILR